LGVQKVVDWQVDGVDHNPFAQVWNWVEEIHLIYPAFEHELLWVPDVIGGWEPEVIGREPDVIGWEPEVIGWEPEVIGWEPEVIGWEPEVSGREPDVIGWAPDVIEWEVIEAEVIAEDVTRLEVTELVVGEVDVLPVVKAIVSAEFGQVEGDENPILLFCLSNTTWKFAINTSPRIKTPPFPEFTNPEHQ